MPEHHVNTDSAQTRVYKYGLIQKAELPYEAIQQLYLRNKLWNTLVELHNKNWEDLEEARCEANADYAQNKEELV